IHFFLFQDLGSMFEYPDSTVWRKCKVAGIRDMSSGMGSDTNEAEKPRNQVNLKTRVKEHLRNVKKGE
ncbi:hypothetical protein L9F63_006932, partial [Diploptera punctata]